MTGTAAPEVRQTVFVVEDDAAVSESLCDLIASAGLTTRLYSSAEELLRDFSPAMTGCLLIDVRLPGMSGMELQAKLNAGGVEMPIIIMTAHGDIQMVRKALKSGAVEFLAKPFQDDELLQAIEQAFALDRARRAASQERQSIAGRWEKLSDRERQVMALVTDGLLNKQIADQLSLSIVTVKLYRRQVMEKMQAESLADLVRMCEKLRAAREL